MKDQDFTAVFAVTADQRHSRRAEDRVPQALAGLDQALQGRALLPAERTAGDEIQLLLARPADVLQVVEELSRQGGWRLGIGLGAVETPVPPSTRSARGPAYLAARAAVERSHATPTGLALMVAMDPTKIVGGAPYSDHQVAEDGAVRTAEAALWLLQELLRGRSAEGWQIVELLDEGIGVGQAAQRLGISASAASQRHHRAGWEVGVRGRELCIGLLAALQTGVSAGAGA